jgi:hypothetical protein
MSVDGHDIDACDKIFVPTFSDKLGNSTQWVGFRERRIGWGLLWLLITKQLTGLYVRNEYEMSCTKQKRTVKHITAS